MTTRSTLTYRGPRPKHHDFTKTGKQLPDQRALSGFMSVWELTIHEHYRIYEGEIAVRKKQDFAGAPS